jgi:hypothetical protein
MPRCVPNTPRPRPRKRTAMTNRASLSRRVTLSESFGCGGGGWQQNVSGEGACAPFYRNGGYSGMMKGWIAPSWRGSSNR